MGSHGFYGEVLQRQGTWVTRHSSEPAAERWVAGRVAVEARSVNPVVAFGVRPIPVRPLITSIGETVCPACLGPVAGSVGIHFDCRS